MKVNSIQNVNLSFTAGKVDIFSDFDGTYFSESQFNLHDITSEKVRDLNVNLNTFDDFIKNTESDIDFKITTGRTFGEFENMVKLMKSKGIEMQFPNSFISKNGSDEYLKLPNCDKVFPYDYNLTNKTKEENIKSISGWMSDIKSKLTSILAKFNFNIIEHDSEYPVKDHGTGSLFNFVGYDNFELSDNMQPTSEWKVGLRRDGNLKLHISYPYDMLHVNERKQAYSDISKEFETYLSSSNIKYVKETYIDKAAGNRPTVTYVPKMNDGTALSKLYDAKEAIKNAIVNNDLVITSGDGFNDYDMLNPLNYLEGKKDITNPETIQELKRLPFVGIVIKGENTGLEGLKSEFGKYGKIIEVEKGQLLDGIKQAIQLYAKENPKFLENMSDSLKSNVGMPVNVSDVVKSVQKHVGAKIAVIVAGLSAAAGAAYVVINNKSEGKRNEG